MSTGIDHDNVSTDVDDSRLEDLVTTSEDDVSDDDNSIFGDDGGEAHNVSQSQFLFFRIVWVYHVFKFFLLVFKLCRWTSMMKTATLVQMMNPLMYV